MARRGRDPAVTAHVNRISRLYWARRRKNPRESQKASREVIGATLLAVGRRPTEVVGDLLYLKHLKLQKRFRRQRGGQGARLAVRRVLA